MTIQWRWLFTGFDFFIELGEARDVFGGVAEAGALVVLGEIQDTAFNFVITDHCGELFGSLRRRFFPSAFRRLPKEAFIPDAGGKLRRPAGMAREAEFLRQNQQSWKADYQQK